MLPDIYTSAHIRTELLDYARRMLLQGEALPDNLLPPAIARSWQRSYDAGIHPWNTHLTNSAVENYALTTGDQVLAACAVSDIDRLWDVFGGPSWALLCVNADGLIVYSRTSKGGPVDLLRVGRRINESDIGTTAPSCTLMEKKPFVLLGGQHYLKEFEQFFCVSVPVYRADGELAGALDITGIGERNTRLVFEQLRIAAMAVENRLFLREHSDQRIISIQPDQQMLGTPFQGLIAVDEQGQCQVMNHNARQMLQAADGAITHDTLTVDVQNAMRSATEVKKLALADGTFLYAAPYPQSFVGNRAIKPTPIAPGIGRDPVLIQQFEYAAKAFRAGIPLLINGETGSGKEVFARALHDHLDSAAPFVAINCSAIPESLIESELFGYVEGAFTGARRGGASGRLEDADGGTLLLDEIGDMPMILQTRLLRVLQERTVTRLGSSNSKPLNIRVICLTHRNLELLIREQHFREDLYYRLKGLQLNLPPLRERRDINYLLDNLLARFGGAILQDDCRQWLLQQLWPGNIRQLEQALRLASALAGEDQLITLKDFPQEGFEQPSLQPTRTLAEIEKEAIMRCLKQCDGNVSAAAEILKISRTTLYKKISD